VPVPDKAIVIGEFDALLAMLTFAPLTAPPVVGANLTVSAAVCPGVNTVPLDTPLALNPAPVTVTAEIVMFDCPLFVNVLVSEPIPSSSTLPKARLAGFAPSDTVAAWPVPERLITSEEGVPLVVSVIDPFNVEAEEGSKVASNVALPLAAIVVDVVSPVWLNPAPVTLTWENESVVFPLFLSVMGCESVFPCVTAPKATLEGFAEICACRPVPLNAIVAGEIEALLVIEMLPEALPPAVGVNVTVKVVFAPALIDVGCKFIV
jgi:hypothetical protein